MRRRRCDIVLRVWPMSLPRSWSPIPVRPTRPPDVAREFGATVFPVPLGESFRQCAECGPRGHANRLGPGPGRGRGTRQRGQESYRGLLETSNAGGYLVPIRNYIPTVTGRGWDRIAQANTGSHPRAQAAPAYFVHENCRLFRRDPGIYFVGRVHELVEPRINALGRRLPMAPFYIHHFGHLAQEETRNQKAVAYRDCCE